MATPIMPKTPIIMPAPAVTPVTEPPAGPTPSINDELEKASELILTTVPKYIADAAREAAYVTNRQPLWSLMAGHILKAYENGDIQAPILDPAWPRRFPDIGNAFKAVLCEYKDGPRGEHTFIPKRYKQRFCSNDCGIAATMKPRVEAAPSA